MWPDRRPPIVDRRPLNALGRVNRNLYLSLHVFTPC